MTSEGTPTVGVFVPSYNAEEFIAECLDSLLKQTYQLSQIVVCDDASTDNTPAIVREYISQHPGLVSAILHKENRGIPSNFNSGLAAIETDLVSLIAADDYWHPEKIEREVARLQQAREARWVYSRSRQVDRHGNDIGPFERKYDGAEGDILGKVLTHKMALRNYTVERTLYENIGEFDESFDIFEDWDMKIRLAAESPVAFADSETVYYRKHGDGASSSPPQIYIQNLKIAYKKHEKKIDLLSEKIKKEVLLKKEKDLSNLYRRQYNQSLSKANWTRALLSYTYLATYTKHPNLRMLAKLILYPLLRLAGYYDDKA